MLVAPNIPCFGKVKDTPFLFQRLLPRKGVLGLCPSIFWPVFLVLVFPLSIPQKKKGFFLFAGKDALSYRNILQKHVVFPAEECGFRGTHCRKTQEIAGGIGNKTLGGFCWHCFAKVSFSILDSTARWALVSTFLLISVYIYPGHAHVGSGLLELFFFHLLFLVL